MGLMAAWLAKGQDLLSRCEHWADDAFPTYEERLVAREEFRAEGGADVEGILASEALLDDEGDEPEEIVW